MSSTLETADSGTTAGEIESGNELVIDVAGIVETPASLDESTTTTTEAADFSEFLKDAPEWGIKTAAENRVILHRSIIAWAQDYRVPFFFAGSRRTAEVTTFRFFERYWRKQQEQGREAAKSALEVARQA